MAKQMTWGEALKDPTSGAQQTLARLRDAQEQTDAEINRLVAMGMTREAAWDSYLGSQASTR